MVFLQIGFATSHPRMLKLKVSFKSSGVLLQGITVAAVVLSEGKDLNG
jgi:hypothetical protein